VDIIYQKYLVFLFISLLIVKLPDIYMSIGHITWNGRTRLSDELRVRWKEAVVAYCKENCIKI